jgi:hypothetical protein
MTPDACIILPEPVRRHGAELLHLQCWLWGCDIRRAGGNLLLEYGFSRQRPPSGAVGSSAYLMALESGTHVVLWGFGAFYGNPAERVASISGGTSLPQCGLRRSTRSVCPGCPTRYTPQTYHRNRRRGSGCIGSLLRCLNGSRNTKCGCATRMVSHTGVGARKSRRSTPFVSPLSSWSRSGSTWRTGAPIYPEGRRRTIVGCQPRHRRARAATLRSRWCRERVIPACRFLLVLRRAIRSGTPDPGTARSRSSFSVQLTVRDCASINPCDLCRFAMFHTCWYNSRCRGREEFGPTERSGPIV